MKTPKDKAPEKMRGIRAAARALGVSAGHLSRVARGERRSPRIEAALADLLPGWPSRPALP